MRKRIIDLRDEALSLEPQPETPTAEGMRQMPATPEKSQSLRTKPIMEWTAHEYPHTERGQHWWIAPSAGALICVIFGILVHSYLFVGFVILSLGVILLYVRRAPKEYRFAISREGVYIGETRHRFAELTSFWIFDHLDHPELSLETKGGRVFPHIHIPLGDIHPNRVRRVLSDFLPEQEHKELFTDQIARSIGF